MSRHAAFTLLSVLRADLTSSRLVVVAVLVCLLASMVGAWNGRRLAMAAVVPLALGWLVVNGPVEGPTLLPLTYNHGLTLADLLSGAALVALVRGLVTRGPTGSPAAR